MILRARVFGRHSLWVAYIVGLTVIASLGLLVGGARAALREPVVRREHSLPLDFPHTKHVEVACARRSRIGWLHSMPPQRARRS
jgi:hypothetical protein